MAGTHQNGTSLVERIGALEAKFQQFAHKHDWICLATKNHEQKSDDRSTPIVPEFGQLTDGRLPPMFFPLVSPPKDPRLIPVLDQVQQLTNEASDLLFAVLDSPNRLPTKLVNDIRDWDSDNHLLIRGGWLYLLRYVTRSQHIYVFPNYCQVAAIALSYLRDKCESAASIPTATSANGSAVQNSPISKQPLASRAKRRKGLKEPNEKQRKLYMYRFARGMKQTDLADDPAVMSIYGRRVTQGTISRDLARVAAWVTAGNLISGQTTPLNSQPSAVDPERLDLGERRDHRAKRQRPLKNSNED